MKVLLVFICLVLGSASAGAQEQEQELKPSFFPLGKAGASTTYKSLETCETTEGQKCLNMAGKVIANYDAVTTQVDDPSRPIEKPDYNVGVCDSPTDCMAKMDALPADYCNNTDRVKSEKNSLMPGYKYFCTGVSGYEKKDVLTMVLNEAKNAAYVAAVNERQAQEAALNVYEKSVEFGNRMVALITLRNKAKNLTRDQKKTLFNSYRSVLDFLQAGALEDAKAEIAAVPVAEPIVAQADKDALIAEIDSFLTN